jgi:hypothetical protein
MITLLQEMYEMNALWGGHFFLHIYLRNYTTSFNKLLLFGAFIELRGEVHLWFLSMQYNSYINTINFFKNFFLYNSLLHGEI